jgi:hypothetical protein
MVQGYYTLDEAARILGMAPDQLSQMAQRREVRAFADRGTWRFRTQDIEELSRRRGMGSDPDLPLGEAPRPKAHDSPVPKSAAAAAEAGLFNFSLGSPDSSDQVQIGQEMLSDAIGGPKSGSKSSPKSPTPKAGSDSDVRLVPEASDLGFPEGSDSDVKVVDAPAPVAKKGPDSGRRVKPDSDSDVKIVPDSSDENTVPLGRQPPVRVGTDSDIRLEESDYPSGGKPRVGQGPDDSALTEEIDLDAEIRQAEEAARAKQAGKKVKPSASAPPSPATSPFELSGTDVQSPKLEASPDSSSDFDVEKKPDSSGEFEMEKKPDSSGEFDVDKPTDSSSDFELKPMNEDRSPIDVGSDEIPVVKDEEVALGEPVRRGAPSSDSGINLQDPADSGISLEQKSDGSDEIEFELSLDTESTPKPAPAAKVDSDSEFELTLDDSGRLAPLEEEASAKAGEEKDIFETDFEVPALEDESGSQAVSLDESDTDLESSDFDLALGEEDIATEDESGSQVVVLEDEDADEGAATVARTGRRGSAAAMGAVAEDDEIEELLGEEDEEELVPVRRGVAPPAPEAEWGPVPVIALGVGAVLLFVVGLMSFELAHGMWGYRQPHKVSGTIVKSFSELLGAELPKD